MPPRTRTNATPNGPVKKAAPKRVRRTPEEKAGPAGIATKRAQTRGEDGPGVDPYAVTSWATEDGQGTLSDLVLPSGQVCLVQRPRPEDLVIAGMLDELDLLAGLVPDPSNPRKRTANNQQLANVAKDPRALKQAMTLMNRLVVHVVIKPELTAEPDDPAAKEKGKIYPSSISLDDKTFIFNWALGGTRDLAKFRREFAESVADVAAVEDLDDETE